MVLEYSALKSIEWEWEIVGLIVLFGLSMFALYSTTPFLLQLSSATLMNISFLTSDAYSLILGIYIFHYQVQYLFCDDEHECGMRILNLFCSCPRYILFLCLSLWADFCCTISKHPPNLKKPSIPKKKSPIVNKYANQSSILSRRMATRGHRSGPDSPRLALSLALVVKVT